MRYEEQGKRRDANDMRFIALFTMIGDGVTGLCPQLEEKKEKLETLTQEYIQALQ